MAFLILTRCFLLLLLASDWAGDPYHGHSPLSQSMASQIYCCHSIRPQLPSESNLGGMFLFLDAIPSSILPSLPPNSLGMEAASQPHRIPVADLIYVYMSLKR